MEGVGISLACSESTTSTFPKHYIEKVKEVFRFDLDHNGMMKLVSKPSFSIDMQIKGDILSVKIVPSSGDDATRFDGVPLSGCLADDRKTIHRLADAIHREICGSDGIASTRILYTFKTNQGGEECAAIWEADYDGENSRQVTKSCCGYCMTPCYLPAAPGKCPGSFFYVSYQTGQPKIYVSSLQKGVGYRVSHLKGNQLLPAVSRQRDRVAFISDVTGNPDLFVQDFSPEKGPLGKPRQLFTAPYATQGSPAFSPDGNRLAFVSNQGGSPRIYLLTLDKAHEKTCTLVTKENRENTAPAWSPDGTKLVYCAKTKGVRQIWLYDFLTGKERQLTTGERNKENPTWGPNSIHVIYNTSDADACDLYLLNTRRLETVKISSGPGEKRFPSWDA